MPQKPRHAGRRPTGQVCERKTKSGTVYAIRFRAYGERHYETLGSTAEGWSRKAAETELQNRLADVRREIWQPPQPFESVAQTQTRFAEFAEEWLESIRQDPDYRPATIEIYEWAVGHLLPYFGEMPLAHISARSVDHYKMSKQKERATKEREGGRGLSNLSINKTLTRLGQILERAQDYGLIESNPALGKKRRAKVSKGRKTYLNTADQLGAILEAAAALQRRVQPGRDRALVATLLFAGPRISEALALRRRDVDLTAKRLTVGDSKTEAGERDVNIVPFLLDELGDYLARHDLQPGDYVFGTTQGTRDNPENVRKRVIRPAVKAANAALEARGLAPMPDSVTPHSLRRTFASVLVCLDENPVYVAGQMGHTDPAFTLGVYASIMRDRGGEKERIRELVNGGLWALAGNNAEISELTAGNAVGADPLETATGSGIQEARAAGFEPATSCSGGRRSIH